MEISKTAVGVLAGLCILAGAGGAYFATRGERAGRRERRHRGAARQPRSVGIGGRRIGGDRRGRHRGTGRPGHGACGARTPL